MAASGGVGQQPRDIAGDQVDFEIHPLAGDRLAEIGAGEGMRDAVYAEAVSRHLVDRETDTVERDRTLRGDEAGQFLGCLEQKAHRLGIRPPLDTPRDAVDMARHEMPAELAAEPQRS